MLNAALSKSVRDEQHSGMWRTDGDHHIGVRLDFWIPQRRKSSAAQHGPCRRFMRAMSVRGHARRSMLQRNVRVVLCRKRSRRGMAAGCEGEVRNSEHVSNRAQLVFVPRLAQELVWPLACEVGSRKGAH